MTNNYIPDSYFGDEEDYRDFIPDDALQDAITFIQGSDISPDEVFTEEQLERWCRKNKVCNEERRVLKVLLDKHFVTGRMEWRYCWGDLEMIDPQLHAEILNLFPDLPR